jgi:hypothetical protein
MVKFNVEQGLTDPVVFGFYEDSLGRIWFRTLPGSRMVVLFCLPSGGGVNFIFLLIWISLNMMATQSGKC